MRGREQTLQVTTRCDKLTHEAHAEMTASFDILGELAAELVHELRNSLQVIATQAYLGRDNAGRAQASCVVIERQAAEAQATIADIFALADPANALSLQRTTLGELSAANGRSAPPQATFTFEGEDLPLTVHPRLFARALRLLYDNAVAIGATAIRTTTVAGTDHTFVFVEDDGPGVPEAIRDSLFTPFVTMRRGGTGLGLSLAKRIAKAHGGELTLVERGAENDPGAPSDPLGGALFCFALPPSRD